MTKAPYINSKFIFICFALIIISCKHKKKLQNIPKNTIGLTTDTASTRCKLDFKSAKTLSKKVKENEFKFEWISAKAKVISTFDGKDDDFDIRLKGKRDSAMLITIETLLGIDVAKILITRDSIKVRIDIKRQYFVSDFNYINHTLNADLDFDVLQSVLFGNSAEFYDDDETRLKPVADRTNCHYQLSTERKRRLRKIQQGTREVKKAIQILTLNPENFKILKNEFIDPATNRSFTASYKNFTVKDSVFAPYSVDIDIVAEKKASVKIEYVRIEKNSPQKLSLNIPKNYDAVEIRKSQQ